MYDSLIDYNIKHSSKSRGADYAARLYSSTQLGGLAGWRLCGFSEGMTVAGRMYDERSGPRPLFSLSFN